MIQLRVWVFVVFGGVLFQGNAFSHTEAKSAFDSLAMMVSSVFQQANMPPEDIPVPENDGAMTHAEKHDRLLNCYNMVRAYVTAHSGPFALVSEQAASARGLRDDDVHRLYFHGAVVACYTNATPEDIKAVADKTISDESMVRVLWFDEDITPTRLSKSQYAILDEVVSLFQVDEDDEMAEQVDAQQQQQQSSFSLSSPSGLAGVVYLGGLIGVMLTIFIFAVRKLLDVEQKKKLKGKKTSRDGAVWSKATAVSGASKSPAALKRK